MPLSHLSTDADLTPHELPVKKATRWRFLFPILLGLLLPVVVVAGVAVSYGSLDTAVSVFVRGDVFLVAPSPVRLYGVVPGSIREFQLVLRKFSGRDLTIVEGRTSCGCLTVPLTGQVVKANGRVTVAGELTSATDDVGQQSLKIHIWLDGSDQVVEVPVEVMFAAPSR